MNACHGVEFVLAGSIRDDGAAGRPDRRAGRAATDAEKLGGVTLALMIATTLHSIAVGNLLPAWVKVVSVDINPSTAIKLSDRGTFQTVGLVTDVELPRPGGRTARRQPSVSNLS